MAFDKVRPPIKYFIPHIGPTAYQTPTKKNATNFLKVNCASSLAETEGFEPSIPFRVYTLSRRAPSTTRTSLLKDCKSKRFDRKTAVFPDMFFTLVSDSIPNLFFPAFTRNDLTIHRSIHIGFHGAGLQGMSTQMFV